MRPRKRLTFSEAAVLSTSTRSEAGFSSSSLDLPFLQIVTDYSEADTEQLKVRIEAFLEMLN